MDRATRLLVSSMGADVLISKPDLPSLRPLQLEPGRRRQERALLAEGAVPFEFPEDGRRAKVCVVWDMPRKRIHETRVILRRALIQHQVHQDDVAHVWAVGRGQDHPPLRSELAAFRHFTLSGIQLANAEHVILVGGPVTSLWWPNARLGRVAGNGYVWDDHYVYPVFSPLALHHDLTIKEYLHSFGRLAWGIHEGSILSTLDLYCHDPGCNMKSVVHDQRAAGWCDTHFKISKSTNQEKRWIKESAKTNQQTLI